MERTSTRATASLNLTHLRALWSVIREGGISAAARRLEISQSTISEHVRALESAYGQPLLVRRSDGVHATPLGRTVMGYAESMFALARQLEEAVQHGEQPVSRLAIGISEAIPKRVAWRLIEPALRSEAAVMLDCREDSSERLLADLAAHRLDVVIAEAPLPPGSPIRAYNHLLGESEVSWFAKPGVIGTGEWPARLHGAPILLPGTDDSLRRRLDDWIDHHGVLPRIVAQIDDSGLLKAAGAAGAGAFAAPTVLRDGLQRELGVTHLGKADGISLRFYAISPERRISDPRVKAITTAARAQLGDLT